MDPRTDEKLVEAYRRGETDAFRLLVERYHDDLLRFLTRLGGDRQIAEDAFQEAFLQVHLSLGSFDTGRRFARGYSPSPRTRPVIFSVGRDDDRPSSFRRRSVRRAGSASDGGSFIDLLEVDVPPPDSELLDHERDELVQRALDQLSDPLREILLLAYFQRLTYAQVAEELGIPLGTVKSRLHAAVATFAKRWKELSAGSKDTDAQ